jgi:small subunit ribosomal protein S18
MAYSKPKLKVSARLLRKRTKKSGFGAGKKQCRFCSNREVAQGLDYKNTPLLRGFLTERGKILSSRISGVCTLHQRRLANEVKKARIVSLLPFAAHH